MKLKEGKRYVTRSGDVTDEVRFMGSVKVYPYAAQVGEVAGLHHWTRYGEFFRGQTSAHDLVAEYVEKSAQDEWHDEGIAMTAEAAEPVWPEDAPPMEGRKDDTGKDPYHLIAPEMLTGLAQVLAFGAQKYAPRNWEKGMDWSRPFSALMRHMWAWWRGERADPETGFSHLWHAACCVMFLVAYEERKAGKDDRP